MPGAAWIDRYQDGQCVQVWAEMLQLGGQVRHPDHLADAKSVGAETMRRINSNLDRLIDGLDSMGYIFEPGSGLATRKHVEDTDVATLESLELTYGQFPLALSWWLQMVGEVNLIGRHPKWTPQNSHSEDDPLVVQAHPAYLDAEFDEWERLRGTIHDAGALVAPIAPDHLHKANISGGPPESMKIPNEAVDGLVLGSRSHTTLINHVRQCFAGGGFAHWTIEVPAEVASLAESLEQI